MRRPRSLLIVSVLLGITLALTACAPGTSVVAPPTFTFVQQGSGLVRIDPPGVGSGAAVFRVNLNVENPNAFGVRLASLTGDLDLQGVTAARASFAGGLDLPARGDAPLSLDVSIPLVDVPRLLPVLAGLVAGTPTEVSVDAEVGLSVFGTVQRFPRFTAVRATVTAPLAMLAPRLLFDASQASVRVVSLSRVELSLRATLDNPSAIGYLASVPTLSLQLDGQPAARASLDPVAVPALGSVPVTFTFAFDPMRLGAAIAGRLQTLAAGTGSVAFALDGGWRLQAPGVATAELPSASLLSGLLR